MESDDDSHYQYHGKAGKATDEVMKYFFKIVHKKRIKLKPCALVLDQYPSHASDSTKQYAKKYNIELFFVPVSATDQFQPLDEYIFGIMKLLASSFFDDANALLESKAKSKKIQRIDIDSSSLSDYCSNSDDDDLFSPEKNKGTRNNSAYILFGMYIDSSEEDSHKSSSLSDMKKKTKE